MCQFPDLRITETEYTSDDDFSESCIEKSYGGHLNTKPYRHHHASRMSSLNKNTIIPPLTIMNSTVTAVESFRFLGTISQDLKRDNHIESMVKKAQQRLYFLCQLRKFNLPQELSDTVLLCSRWIHPLHINNCLVQLSYQIWPQKTTEDSPDCWANHWYNPPHSPVTVLIQSEQKYWQNHSGPFTSSTLLLWTITVWSTLQSSEHQKDQTQKQFISPSNPSHQHLTLNVEHTTLLYNYLFITHTYFSFQNCTCQTSHIIACIVYCVFDILYISYLYIILL